VSVAGFEGWGRWRNFMMRLTIVVSQNEYEDRLEAKKVQEIPRERRDPSDIEVASGNARLKHGFEAEG